MKTVKGILTYTLIALGVLVGLGILLMGFMFIFPSLKLFGYGFVYNTKTRNDEDVKVVSFKDTFEGISGTQIENIALNIEATDGINVHIVASDKDSYGAITAIMRNKYYGFYKGERYTTLSKPEVALTGTTLNYSIKANGVEGAIHYSDTTYIEVTIPRRQLKDDWTADDTVISYNMNLKSYNGKISVAGVAKNDTFLGAIELNALECSTNNGGLSLFGVGSNVTGTEKPTTLNLEHLNLTTQHGTFDFSGLDTVTVDDSLTLSASRGDFVFHTLKVNDGDLTVEGNNVLLSAKNLTLTNGKLDYNAVNGVFRVTDELRVNGSVSIASENTPVTIGKALQGNIGIKTNYGDVNIKDTSNVTTYIKGGHGNVYIKECTEALFVSTTYGNITVDSYKKSASISTDRGTVTLTNTTTGTSNSAFKQYRTIIDLTGKTTLNFKTSAVPFTITSTENCTLNVTVDDVLDRFAGENEKSYVNMSKGTLNIKIPNLKAFVITAKGTISGSPVAEPQTLVSGQTYELLFDTQDAYNSHTEFELNAPIINFVK